MLPLQHGKSLLICVFCFILVYIYGLIWRWSYLSFKAILKRHRSVMNNSYCHLLSQSLRTTDSNYFFVSLKRNTCKWIWNDVCILSRYDFQWIYLIWKCFKWLILSNSSSLNLNYAINGYLGISYGNIHLYTQSKKILVHTISIIGNVHS